MKQEPYRIRLAPCPFCGENVVGMQNAWASRVNFYVQCYTCGCSTALFNTAEKAAEAWNRRAQEGGKQE